MLNPASWIVSGFQREDCRLNENRAAFLISATEAEGFKANSEQVGDYMIWTGAGTAGILARPMLVREREMVYPCRQKSTRPQESAAMEEKPTSSAQEQGYWHS